MTTRHTTGITSFHKVKYARMSGLDRGEGAIVVIPINEQAVWPGKVVKMRHEVQMKSDFGRESGAIPLIITIRAGTMEGKNVEFISSI